MKLGSTQRAFLERVVHCGGSVTVDTISLPEIRSLRGLLAKNLLSADDIPARTIMITEAGRAALGIDAH